MCLSNKSKPFQREVDGFLGQEPSPRSTHPSKIRKAECRPEASPVRMLLMQSKTTAFVPAGACQSRSNGSVSDQGLPLGQLSCQEIKVGFSDGASQSLQPRPLGGS
jgi:hypothetical protein